MVKLFIWVDTQLDSGSLNLYTGLHGLGFDNQAMKLSFPTDLVSWSEYSKGNIQGNSIYLHY